MHCGREFFFFIIVKKLFSFEKTNYKIINKFRFRSEFFSELGECFNALNENPDCRAIVLSGAGKYFTAGLDLKESLSWAQQLAEIEDSARKGHFLEKKIKAYQVKS